MRYDSGPVVIGGLGGSGTRVVAQILLEAGVFIGGCLNKSLDNLWFTLLFRRPGKIRSWSDVVSLEHHLDVFDKRMHGKFKWSGGEKKLLRRCAWEFAMNGYVRNDRFGFPWHVYRSFFREDDNSNHRWGWKEPNAHVFLPLLLKRYPGLRYIHVMRHPLDIVFGKNHLQLRNWKHLFGITETNDRLAMLQYYECANQRAAQIRKTMGNNFMLLKHEDLCHQPAESIDNLLDFCSLKVDKTTTEKLYAIPSAEKVSTDYLRHDFRLLMPAAERVATQFGYSVS